MFMDNGEMSQNVDDIMMLLEQFSMEHNLTIEDCVEFAVDIIETHSYKKEVEIVEKPLIFIPPCVV